MKKLLIPLTWIFLISSLAFLFVLQWHNIATYPIQRGFDAFHHLDYIKYVKIHKAIPLPNQGWEMWQAPLYYVIGAILPTFKALQYIHLLMWVILGLSCYVLFRKIFKDNQLAIIGVLLTISLPVVLYMTPLISNEFFSAVIISVTMVYYLLKKNEMTLKSPIILGLLLGLTILSKATGTILVAVILIDQLLEKRKDFFLSFGVMVLLGGWFYLRNIWFFHNPFIASIDFPAFAFTAPPENRGVAFFLNLMPFFQGHLFTAQHESFLPGSFFSFFYDGHNNVIPVQEFSKIGLMLVMISVPLIILSIIGYVKELRSEKKNRLFLLYIPLLFLSYILYNFKIPYYSTVKGAFLLSSILPFSYFVIKSLEEYKKYIFFFSLYMFLYVVVLTKNFWILSWWYRM